MRRLFILMVFFIIIHSGCRPIAKTIIGIKSPQIENQESVENWLRKQGIRCEITTVKPEKFYSWIQFWRKPLLFEKETGSFVGLGDPGGNICPKNMDLLLKELMPYDMIIPKPGNYFVSAIYQLPPGSDYSDRKEEHKVLDTTYLNLYHIAEGFHDFKGEKFSIDQKQSDYVLLIPFAMFLGKNIQMKNLRKCYEAAMENRKTDIRVIFVNLDKQQWWGGHWNDMINIKI